jgi:hypothetical protein
LIGATRRSAAPKSKGRGRQKRKKKHELVPQSGDVSATDSLHQSSPIVIGYNATVRSLETCIQKFGAKREVDSDADGATIAVIVACRNSVKPPALDSLPLLAATASATMKQAERIRLIDISAQGEAVVAEALALPLVGVLGLRNKSPDVKAAVQYVRDTVPSVEAPWLDSSAIARYLPLKLAQTQAPVGVKGSKKRKAEESEND